MAICRLKCFRLGGFEEDGGEMGEDEQPGKGCHYMGRPGVLICLVSDTKRQLVHEQTCCISLFVMVPDLFQTLWL